LGECVTRKEGGRVVYGGGSGGGGGQPSQQTQITELPEWARPYAKDTLSKASALTDINQNPYQTYDANRIAGFSPLQQQAMTQAGNMAPAGQLGAATGLAGTAGQRAMDTQYTPGQFGMMQARGPSLQQYQMGPAQQVGTQDYTGQNVSQYMNPYMQNVVDIQQREAQRQADVAGTQRGAQAARSGAFGGSRAGLMEAEAARNLALQKGDIQAQGQNAAFQNAQQQFNTQQQRDLQAQLANQGMGFNVGQQNLNAMLGVQQLGAGQNLQAQLANQQTFQQAQQAREQSRQYGAGLGMQGLQTGLQAAGQLGQLGGQQFAQGMDINKLQAGYGAQQQALEQQGLSQSYQDFLNQQNYPYKQLGFMSDILRGTPTGSSSVTQMYQAQPGGLQTAAGLGLGAYGLSKMFADGGSVTSDYNTSDIIDKLSDQQLQAARQNAQARKDVGTLELIDEELAQRASERGGMSAAFNQLPPNAQEDMYKAANGGIVAFAKGGSYADQAQKAISGLSEMSLTTPTPEEYEKGVTARMPFIEKMYGADTLAPYLAETKAEREKLKSGKAIDEAKGLGALLAAAKMIGAPNIYKGTEGAIEAFGGEVARVKKENKEADRLLRASEIQLATAAQARKEGLTGKAMTAQDKADGQAMEAQKLKVGVQEKTAQLLGGLAQAEMSGKYQLQAAGISANKPTDLARQTDIVYQGMLEAGAPANKQTMAKAAAQAASDLGRYPGEARAAAAQAGATQKSVKEAKEAWANSVLTDKTLRKQYETLRKEDPTRAEAFRDDWIEREMSIGKPTPQGAPAQGAPQKAPQAAAPVKITSQEEFAKLPKGTTFIAPDGSVRIKP
jgi:hypothetical protein